MMEGKVVNRLSTGLVIAGAYATKLRKTLFAQLKDLIKQGVVTSNEVARAAGEINRILFEVLVNKLSVDKGDAVRVRVEYEVEDGKIKWRLGTLELEVFRRVPDTDVREALEEVLREGAPTFKYEVRKRGETPIGDVVFDILENGEKVGLLLATPSDGEVIVRGALANPPRLIEKTRLTLRGDVERTVAESIQVLSERAKPSADEVVEKVMKEIEELVA